MAKMGRPKAIINKEEFEKLCALQCTLAEICDWFNVQDDTLNSWCKENYDGKTFSEIFKVKRGKGLVSLRRNQWKLAEKNAAMAIFLGKNYLGQKDNVEVTDNTAINKNIQCIADLINKPKPNRTEEDLAGE